MSSVTDSGTPRAARLSRGVPHTRISSESIEDFCGRWEVAKLTAFGYLLDDEFDFDVELGFVDWFDSPDNVSLWTIALMREELIEMFGRRIVLTTTGALDQGINIRSGRRKAILNSMESVYEA